jgi:acetyltransferase-like isoleucine patch superfamily enzyme
MAQKSPLRTAVFNVAGVYRVVWRPLSNGVLIARALLEEWIWGMEPVTELIGKARGRQLPALLRAMGAQIGEEVDLRHPLIIHNPQDRLKELSIGAQTHVGKDCLLDLSGVITIENNVTLAMRVTVISHFDAYLSPLRLNAYPSEKRGVVIESGAYIGAGAILLMGVRVGRCAVVAAGAVVREDVPPYTMVAGVPARVIKQLNPTEVEPQ